MTRQIFFILVLLVTTLFDSCSPKKTFQYKYNENIPDTIEQAFIKEYSNGLEFYEWKAYNNLFEVHFTFHQDNKIATYDSSASLKKMQTEVLLKDRLLEEFKSNVLETEDFEVINCFLVVKKDSIYHKVYYKDKKGHHNINLVPGIPEL